MAPQTLRIFQPFQLSITSSEELRQPVYLCHAENRGTQCPGPEFPLRAGQTRSSSFPGFQPAARASIGDRLCFELESHRAAPRVSVLRVPKSGSFWGRECPHSLLFSWNCFKSYMRIALEKSPSATERPASTVTPDATPVRALFPNGNAR